MRGSATRGVILAALARMFTPIKSPAQHAHARMVELVKAFDVQKPSFHAHPGSMGVGYSRPNQRKVRKRARIRRSHDGSNKNRGGKWA